MRSSSKFFVLEELHPVDPLVIDQAAVLPLPQRVFNIVQRESLRTEVRREAALLCSVEQRGINRNVLTPSRVFGAGPLADLDFKTVVKCPNAEKFNECAVFVEVRFLNQTAGADHMCPQPVRQEAVNFCVPACSRVAHIEPPLEK